MHTQYTNTADIIELRFITSRWQYDTVRLHMNTTESEHIVPMYDIKLYYHIYIILFYDYIINILDRYLIVNSYK